MTPEAQLIAIAEVCRWKQIRETGIWNHAVSGKNAVPSRGSVHRKRMEMGMPTGRDFLLPDYPGDLNAMHEAEVEAIYAKGLGMVYLDVLTKLVNGAPPYEYKGVSLSRWNASATAAQRAEALLRTLGLWEETTK